MFQQISDKYYVRDLKAILRDFTASCYFCFTDITSRRKRMTIGTNERPTHSREIWSLDLLSGIGTSTGKDKYLAVFIDNFSLFCLAIPLQDKSTSSILQAFKTNVIMPFGFPRILRTDGETAILRSSQFQHYLHELGIRHAQTASASPWTNGLAERTVAKFKESLRTYNKSHALGDFSDTLAFITNSFNSTPTCYGPTPAELMFGYNNSRFTELLPTQTNVTFHDDYLQMVRSNIACVATKLQNKRKQNNESTTASRNSHRATFSFHVGQLVYIKNTAITVHSALTARKKGPYIITKVSPSEHTAYLQHIITKQETKSHFDHIFSMPSTTTLTSLNPDGIDLSIS